MLILLSPAKSLDFSALADTQTPTEPALLDHSAELVRILRDYTPQALATLMDISATLAELNAKRYASWSTPFTPHNAKPAVLAFNGDVYEGLQATTLTKQEFVWVQTHVRILSGLYGVLKPLDLIQPYRLEMGTRLPTQRGHTLYAFWGDVITDLLNQHLAQLASRTVINLASEEYFKAVQVARLNASIITPVFQDYKAGRYKVISFYAKHARGQMARWAAQHAITEPNALKTFQHEGYTFDPNASDDRTWVFRRSLV